MTLIFCISHMYVPATLSIIAKGDDRYCIYTDLKSIHTFFSKMYPDIVVFYDKPVHSSNVLMSIIFDSARAKRNMKEVFDRLKIDKLIFFHEGDGTRANWLIRRLFKRQNAHVVYCPVQRTFDFETKWVEVWSLKKLLLRLYNFVIWNFWSHYYLYLNDVHLVMDKSFFDRTHSTEMQIEISQTDVVGQINLHLLPESKYPLSGIVWIENTLRFTSTKWSEQSYVDVVNSITSALADRRIFFKGHPDMAVKYGVENEMKEIPSFIPGNLLVSRFCCYIGVISALLYEAADAGTLTISLLNLVDMDSNHRQELIAYLKSYNDSIFFPNSIDELYSIVHK